MLSQEEFERLEQRVTIGRDWISSQPGGWGGNRQPPFDYTRDTPRTPLQRAIVRWFALSNELFEEMKKREAFVTVEQEAHSMAWHDMKFEEALEKWKHTLKVKRGPDPRSLPRDSFI